MLQSRYPGGCGEEKSDWEEECSSSQQEQEGRIGNSTSQSTIIIII